MVLIAAMVVVVGSGAGVALWIGRARPVVNAAAMVAPAAAATSVRPSANPTTATSAIAPPAVGPTSSPTPRVPASTSARPAPPALVTMTGEQGATLTADGSVGPSTNLTVSMSVAAARTAHAIDFQSTLQRYFDAINQHDYQAWADAVTPAEQGSQNRADWTQAYSTTLDSEIWILAITGDQVVVRFVSTQDLAFAPAQLRSTCIAWNLTYEMSRRSDRWVVGKALANTVSMSSCA